MAQISQTSALTLPKPDFLSRLTDLIHKYSNLWIAFLLMTGFAFRLWRASGTFLNPDEAMHFQAANQTSWRLAYAASLGLAHPPLLVLLLHAWRSLGTSELVLRMPSVLAGTVLCWLVYRWAAGLFEPAVAWSALIMTLFLPSTVDLSIEVRQYALMLVFAIASAYLFERALKTGSAQAMSLSGVSLWLALGFHYSAFLFAAAMGTYAIVRMLAHRPSWKLIVAWCGGQIVAVGLGCFFYQTHIARLNRGGDFSVHEWIGAYLPSSFFVPGTINPLLFIFARTGGVFQYGFGQMAAGDAAYLLFVLGVVLIVRKSNGGQVTPRQLALLLLLPFAANCAAALAALYPYGGSRHSAFLIPFALLGVSLALGHLLNYRLPLVTLAAIVVVVLCNLFASHRQPYISRPDQSATHMRDALGFIRGQTASDDLIFTDYQGSLMLRHYLCDQRPVAVNLEVQGFRSYECSGHRVVSPVVPGMFIFTPRRFCDRWQALTSDYNLRSGARVWVMQIGWKTHLAASLEAFPEFHLAPHFFGQSIQIFDLTVGQHMPDPESLPTS